MDLVGIAGITRVPPPVNEPNLGYLPGSPERAELKKPSEVDVGRPPRYSCRDRRTRDSAPAARSEAVMPHNHQHVLADWHAADPQHVQRGDCRSRAAARASGRAGRGGSRGRVSPRRGAADDDMAADAERGDDARAVEDRVSGGDRFGVGADRLLALQRRISRRSCTREQPISTHGCRNQIDYRPLEGFVYAVTPFNFTAIGGNLPTAPALMGNTVIWKPASSAMLSGYYILRLLEARGPAARRDQLRARRCGADLEHPARLAGPRRHSLHRQHRRVFNSMWKKVGENIGRYRVVSAHRRRNGRQGLHRRAPVGGSAGGGGRDRARRVRIPGAEVLRGQPRVCAAVALARGPRSRGRDDARHEDGRRHATSATFMGAVIDKKSFDKISAYLDDAKKNAKVIQGGGASGDDGLLRRADADRDDRSRLSTALRGDLRPGRDRLRVRRLRSGRETLEIVDRTSPYALTGAVFSTRSRGDPRGDAMRCATRAGNFYINDKPTGAVVGQQPFGGARASGTNDKAGLETQSDRGG